MDPAIPAERPSVEADPQGGEAALRIVVGTQKRAGRDHEAAAAHQLEQPVRRAPRPPGHAGGAGMHPPEGEPVAASISARRRRIVRPVA